MTDSSANPREDYVSKLDTGVPHSARTWNYWLGGKDNFAIDREVGDRVREAYPQIVEVARASRAFLVRAVRYLAGEAGIRQFLDIGTGLPTANNTHQVAQRVAPESHVVYVDNDPLVLVHARALLTSSPEGVTDYVDADLHDPDKILLDAVPSGSHLVVNDGIKTTEASAQAARIANEAGVMYQLRTREQIAGYFEGLDLAEPGVVPAPQWRPEPGAADLHVLQATCGVGRKP